MKTFRSLAEPEACRPRRTCGRLLTGRFRRPPNEGGTCPAPIRQLLKARLPSGPAKLLQSDNAEGVSSGIWSGRPGQDRHSTSLMKNADGSKQPRQRMQRPVRDSSIRN